MRATVKMSCNTALTNILSNYSNLLKVQNQMSTGSRVNAPSDDPLATNTAMSYDKVISQLTQYTSNIEVADSFLGLSDAALDDVNSILLEAQSLILSSSSDTTTSDMQSSNAQSMSSLLEELISIANSQSGTRYLFGGTETVDETFTIVNDYVCYNGNDEDICVQTDTGGTIPINVTAIDAFGSLINTISTGDLEALLNIEPGTSTKLSSLNGGAGVATGSINVEYTATVGTTGLVVDLSSADTVEDVADLIQQATLDYADSTGSDYALRVELNHERNGLTVVQYNISTGNTVDLTTDPAATAISISEVANNTVADDLGILGKGTTADESVLVGDDVDTIVTANTLLADLSGYENLPFTITNGNEPSVVTIDETGDSLNIFDGWSIAGLSAGENCTDDAEFYSSITANADGTFSVKVYSGSEMLSNQLIASGTTDISGTVVLGTENNSGVSGTVSVNTAPLVVGDVVSVSLKAELGSSFTTTVDVPAFVETGATTGVAEFDTSDATSNWAVTGLLQGTDTDADGNLYVQIEDLGTGSYEVRLYSDSGYADLVASGTLSDDSTGTVTLAGEVGHEDVGGTVTLEWPTSTAVNSGTLGTTTLEMTLTATFRNVGDLLNDINNSNTYVTAAINDDGDGIDISSRLSGSYLTIAQSVEAASHYGDENNQLSHINLSGLVTGENSDYEGTVYAEVVDNGGTYTVNLYSDSAHTSLVATGSRSSDEGTVVLIAANDSGLNGSVYLDYSADDNDIEITPNDYSVSGDDNDQVSQVDLAGLVSGQTADYSGNVYLELEDMGGGVIEVRLYSDSQHNNLVASGSLVGPTSGNVTITDVDGNDLGTIYINYTEDDDDIVIGSGVSGISGQEREQNVFSLFADAIEAMNAADSSAVGELIDDLQDSIDQVLQARSTIGSRQDRLELLTNRHADNIVNFTELRSNEMDVDFAEAVVSYQEAMNTYEAALQVTAQIIPLSLVDYI